MSVRLDSTVFVWFLVIHLLRVRAVVVAVVVAMGACYTCGGGAL